MVKQKEKQKECRAFFSGHCSWAAQNRYWFLPSNVWTAWSICIHWMAPISCPHRNIFPGFAIKRVPDCACSLSLSRIENWCIWRSFFHTHAKRFSYHPVDLCLRNQKVIPQIAFHLGWPTESSENVSDERGDLQKRFFHPVCYLPQHVFENSSRTASRLSYALQWWWKGWLYQIFKGGLWHKL